MSDKEQTALVMTGTDEFALEKNIAIEIAERFLPNIDATKALNKEFQEVIAKEINEETVKEAKTLRLQYVKLRTGTAAIHKTEKNAFLNGGRFVDSCKSVQLLNGEPCETKLKEIETHFETMRKEAVRKLQVEREAYLVEYGVEVFPSLLGEMEQDVWDNYINGVKLNFEAKKKAAADAEALLLKQEEEAKAEQERIRLENEKLKAEAVKRDAKAKAEEKAREATAKKEQEARDKVEATRIAKENAEQEARDLAAKVESDKRDAAAKVEQDKREATAKKEQESRDKAEAMRVAKEKAEQEARDAVEAKRIAEEKKAQDERDRLAKVEADKVLKEKEASEAKLAEKQKELERVEAEEKSKREALEAELKAKKDADALAEKQKEDARQAELSKGDGDKIVDLIAAFDSIKESVMFDSAKNKKLFVNVQALCDKVIKYIKEQTES